MLLLTQFIGWVIAHTPEWLLQLFAKAVGLAIAHGHRRRRRVMLESLAASFPERSLAWRKWVAAESCIRVVETALLSLAQPYLPFARVKRMATVEERANAAFYSFQRDPRPLLFGTTHLAYWEGLTWLPALVENPPEMSAVFRPLRNPKLDEWLRKTRERFGVKLLSRRGGLHAALHVLQRMGVVSILFDQSAGSHGLLTKFFGRECSTSPLPGKLVERTGADVYIILTRRHRFWRFSIDLVHVPSDGTEKGVTLALNRVFEALLRTDENLCASWLWMHQRWRILDRPGEREKLIAKRGGLIE